MTNSSIFKERIDSKNIIYSLNLYRGNEAFEILTNQNFQRGWDNLYYHCPWATVFQHRSFISSWYQMYQEEFQPIIISEQYGKVITGIIHLAIPTKELKKKSMVKIHGAGEFNAEYHAWLTKSNNNSFIKTSLSLLLREFPKCKVILRYLPPETPLSWTNSHQWKRKIILQASKRPLMDTYHPDFPNLLRKRHLKAKYNRINKAGHLKLEEINDTDEFSKLLLFLKDQYDFRQGALFNKNQFRDDPKKAPFLKRLFDAGLLHVSTLKLNDDITAAVISMTDKNWVHLAGLISHSPFYSQYSPGLVQLYMLGRKFYFDHIEVFDLTPGNDPYKDRLATHNDIAYELVITENKLFKYKRAARKAFFDGLYRYGILPQKLKLQFEKNVYIFKNKYKYLLAAGMRSILMHLSASPSTKPFEITDEQIKNAPQIIFKINHLEDLLNYQQGRSTLTRWEFLDNALKRFEEGQNSYSISKNGQLEFCAWIIKMNNKDKKTGTNASLQIKLDYCFIRDRSFEKQHLASLYQFIKCSEKTDQIIFNH
ncbi:GNAT family N-acetyltransferase [Echinicola marina]|uniref:GNAT family N-acetyltransferase n=1 Tax=Echinicola marina TaxID=2859768 RepID=UPI001CF66913|nr:GNAT family N-acetyltransferase [Echinicola marina]UCS92969.1 GNAT family N-acetyltransferase [Echinicola marina]